MANIDAGIILVSVSTYLFVLGKLEDPLTWNAAMKQCVAKGQILSPLNSMALLNDDIIIPGHSVWTPNLILNLGCVRNTDFCPGLFLEKVADNDSYFDLCYEDYGSEMHPQSTKIEVHRRNTTFKNACGGNRGSLIEINSMNTLKEVRDLIFHDIKYRIGSFSMKFQDSFVLLCQVFHKIDNKSRPYETNSNCDDTHQFLCVPDTNYQTVISLIRLSQTAATTAKDCGDLATLYPNIFQLDNLAINMVLYIVTVAVLIIFFGIRHFCKRRKIISSMQQSTVRGEEIEAFNNQSESAEINIDEHLRE